MGKILVRCPNWLGDIVMAIPAINGLKEAFPDDTIYAYVRSEYADIAKRIRGVDQIIPFWKKNLLTEFAMVKTIRNTQCSKAVVLPNSWTSALIPMFAGIKERYGYNVRGRRLFFSCDIPLSEETQKKHHVYHYLELLNKICPGHYNDRPEILVASEEITKYKEKYRLTDKKICGFVPAAAYGEAKCWFKERYGELGRILQGKGFSILMFGAGSDFERCEDISKIIGKDAYNYAGKMNIYEMPVFLKMCSFVVSNDSGPMHVSAALNVPVVSIFGSTNPDTTYPFGFQDMILHRELGCSRCLDRVCERKDKPMECMALISVNDVLKKLEQKGLI